MKKPIKNELTISQLKKFGLPPKRWRIVELRTGGYTLQYRFIENEEDWDEIITTRGQRKIYSSLASAIDDIRKIAPEKVDVSCWFMPASFKD